MINSVGDMYMFMKEHKETHCNFYYKPMSPEELLSDSYIDDVTDDGYSSICEQLGDEGKQAFPFGEDEDLKSLVVTMYTEEDGVSTRFEANIIKIGKKL